MLIEAESANIPFKFKLCVCCTKLDNIFRGPKGLGRTPRTWSKKGVGKGVGPLRVCYERPCTRSLPRNSPMAPHKLNCLIEGEYTVFVVPVEKNDVVSELKEKIHGKRALDSLKDVSPHTLELWKVSAIDEPLYVK